MDAYLQIANDYGISPSGLTKEPVLTITENQLRRLETITRFIQDNFREGRGKSSSYSLKHLVERELKEEVQHYVSNGELMLCMLHCGYKVKDRHGPNLYFGVDTDYYYKDGYKTGKSIFWYFGKRVNDDKITNMEYHDEQIYVHRRPQEPHMWKKGYDQAEKDCRAKWVVPLK